MWKVAGTSHSFRAAPGFVDQQEYYPWIKMSFLKSSSSSLPAGHPKTIHRPLWTGSISSLDFLFWFTQELPQPHGDPGKIFSTPVSLTHKTILSSPGLFDTKHHFQQVALNSSLVLFIYLNSGKGAQPTGLVLLCIFSHFQLGVTCRRQCPELPW